MLNTISVYAIGGGSYIQLTVMRLYTPGYGHLLVLGCILFPMSFFSVQRLVHFLLGGSAVARCPEHKGGASKKEEEAEKACGRCHWTQRRISNEISMRYYHINATTSQLLFLCSTASLQALIQFALWGGGGGGGKNTMYVMLQHGYVL